MRATKISDQPKKKRGIGSYLNPNNWGVDEYEGTFNTAFEKAKKDLKDEFIWNGKRYNTKSNLTPTNQLKKYGITDEQAEGRSIISNRLYKAVKPDDYGPSEFARKTRDFITGHDRLDPETIESKTKQADVLNKKSQSLYGKASIYATPGSDNSKMQGLINKADGLQNQADDMVESLGKDDMASEDAWKMYLGLPQENSTFGVSKYKPTIAKDKDATYYSLSGDFRGKFLDSYKKGRFLTEPDRNTEPMSEGMINQEGGLEARVLGNFTASKGKDERGEYVSYYDKYDLHPTSGTFGQFGGEQVAGKPFEIYDRVYLDEKISTPESRNAEMVKSVTSKFSDMLSKPPKTKFSDGGSIDIKPGNRGKFTSFAKSNSMGVQEAAKHVMANKGKYSPTVVKRANFAKNAAGWKKEDGGSIGNPGIMGVMYAPTNASDYMNALRLQARDTRRFDSYADLVTSMKNRFSEEQPEQPTQ